jgi:hypothetical protein
MDIRNFATWPAWLQITTGFLTWLSLYPWTAKTQRGRHIHLACAAVALLFYFLRLRPLLH